MSFCPTWAEAPFCDYLPGLFTIALSANRIYTTEYPSEFKVDNARSKFSSFTKI